MFITAPQFPLAYQTIVSRARGSPGTTTFILVSPDVDALCAAHQLATLLRTDDVKNTIHPVGSWSELSGMEGKLAGEEVRSLILVNLGALVDLHSYFSYLPPTCLIHVIDSHRPINLANLYTPSSYASALLDPTRSRRRKHQAHHDDNLPPPELSVIIWEDLDEESVDFDHAGLAKEAWEAMQYEPESDSDEDSSDDEDDEDVLPRRRRRGSGGDDEEDDEDDDVEFDENGEVVNRKRKKSGSPRPLSKRDRFKYKTRIQKYYFSGTHTGKTAVAELVFGLGAELERADLDSVWLAIIGMTYQYSVNAIMKDTYDAHQSLLKQEVARLSSDVASLAISLDPLASTGPNDRSIRPSEEMRVRMIRHWNLYDSLYHSDYLGGRMMLWSDVGRKHLHATLAILGCPLADSTEAYQHMDPKYKAPFVQRFKDLIIRRRADSVAPDHSLKVEELFFESFVRKAGFRIDLSALDAVEGISALLEVATGVRLDFGNAVGGRRGVTLGGHEAARVNEGREEWSEGIKSWVGKGGDKENRRPMVEEDDEEGESEIEKKERKEKEWATRNFWLAWDGLSPDTTLLRTALPLSMALHRAVMEQGSYILDKKAIQSLRSFRLAIIKEGPDLTVFRHPSTLLRLAMWLVNAVRDILTEQQPKNAEGEKVLKKDLPFVLAALNEANDAFLVVAVIGAPVMGDIKKNTFGVAFQEAASASGARTRHDAFEASVVEVRKDDLDKFLKHLALG